MATLHGQAMTAMLEISSDSPEETIDIGRLIGGVLAPGDVVGLVGPLGAGKTQLTKGIAMGLGLGDSRLVNSPTFVLVNEYTTRVPIHHIDAYRLAGATELVALGFEEMTQASGVVIVEWADRVIDAIGSESLMIEFVPCGETRRMIRLSTRSSNMAGRMATLGVPD